MKCAREGADGIWIKDMLHLCACPSFTDENLEYPVLKIPNLVMKDMYSEYFFR